MITRDPSLIGAAAALRADVFVTGQGVDPAIEADGADPDAVHAVLLEDGVVVGTGRLLEEHDARGPYARLARIAVREDLRGRRLGARVVRELEHAAAAAGLPRMRLHAQEPVVGFYEHLGWQVIGEPDMEAGLAHRWMERDLLPGLRPVSDDDAEPLQRLIGGCFADYPGAVLELDALDAWMRAPASAYRARGGGLWVLPAPAGGLAASGGWQPGSTGGSMAGPMAGWVELKSLYVASGHRRRGHAAALVGLVARTARERGAEGIELWTDTRFIEAHGLYESLGFQRGAGTRELHDASGSVEYPYRRSPAG